MILGENRSGMEGKYRRLDRDFTRASRKSDIKKGSVMRVS
jgi:hypothetical protein